jgi:hypothetical protein
MDSAYTTLNRTGLQAGKYLFSATDANGCSSSTVYTITQPASIQPGFSVVNSTCNVSNGTINTSTSGGNGAYTYLWSANAGSATSASVSALPAGLYSVQITDGVGCSTVFPFALNDVGSISIVDTIFSAPCNSSSAAIHVGVSGGTAPYTYVWSTGDTTQNVSGLNPGNYSLQASDASGCKNSELYKVFNSYIPEICALTVDTSDNRNEIYWDKSNSGAIKEFKIYRESVANFGFLHVGTVPYDSVSQFKDPFASAVVHAWKYSLSAIDSCGNETGRSYFNYRPYHLYVDTVCSGACNRLVWSNALGVSYTKTYIYRKTSSTAWVLIDSVDLTAVPNNNYVDTNPPAGAFYMLETNVMNTCNPSYRWSEIESNTFAVVKKTRSNVNNNKIGAVGISDPVSPTKVVLFPNPSGNNLTVFIENNNDLAHCIIYDVSGKLIRAENFSGSKHTMFLSEISKGIYVVELRWGQKSAFRKWVKQ